MKHRINALRFEYWPVWLVYLPTLFYWAWLALRARAPLYMTAANPGIEMGGFFGESKSRILDLVPERVKPQTLRIHPAEGHWLELFMQSGLQFPLIAKPDVGERGDGVSLLDSMENLLRFLRDKKELYLLQEYVTGPHEYGVLFYRHPGEPEGKVISITGKKFLGVTGDGQSDIRTLMHKDYRSSRQIKRLEALYDLSEVPLEGEYRLLEPIGNHCRGTEFTNENHRINDAVHRVFSEIAREMQGFYFGRFDLKVSDPGDLETGKHIRVLEVNGTTSEAGHIYSRNYGVFRAYRDIFRSMHLIWQISLANYRNGTPYTPASEFLSTLKRHFIDRKKPPTPQSGDKQATWYSTQESSL